MYSPSVFSCLMTSVNLKPWGRRTTLMPWPVEDDGLAFHTFSKSSKQDWLLKKPESFCISKHRSLMTLRSSSVAHSLPVINKGQSRKTSLLTCLMYASARCTQFCMFASDDDAPGDARRSV